MAISFFKGRWGWLESNGSGLFSEWYILRTKSCNGVITRFGIKITFCGEAGRLRKLNLLREAHNNNRIENRVFRI
jgi:hypothetical protein